MTIQADSYLPEHGTGDYRVEHYDLGLDYRVSGERLAGRARISAVALGELARFQLDLGPFRIARVQVDGRAARFQNRGHKLTVWPAGPVAEGAAFTVEVRYSGRPAPIRSHWGGLGWEPLADGVLVASQPIGAPSWFPCNDRPADKARYRITVTTTSRYDVLANGVLVDRRAIGGATTWVYEQNEPMASYLATIHIGRFARLELAGGPVPQSAAVPADAVAAVKHDFGRQPKIMAEFEKLFGPYPFTGYTVLVVDDELEIPVEAQGISIFGRNHSDRRRGSEALVAHELAHQWFGNSLTVTEWRHIWLNEGFAQYAEWLWSERSGGPSADVLARESWRDMAQRPQDLVLADPGPTRIFDDRVYQRGALTLHALRRTTGDQAFFPLLREWTERHRHGTVDTTAFTTLAIERAGASVTEFFQRWLYTAALPPLPS